MTYYTIEELDLSKQGLTELPDLTKYTNLKKLDCSWNQLTHLDNLPINLTTLYRMFPMFFTYLLNYFTR